MDERGEVLLSRKAAVRPEIELPDRRSRAQPRDTYEELFGKCGDNGAQRLVRGLRAEDEQGVAAADVTDARCRRHRIPARLLHVRPRLCIECICSQDIAYDGQEDIVKDTFDKIGRADVRFEPIAREDVALYGARIKEYRLIPHNPASLAR